MLNINRISFILIVTINLLLANNLSLSNNGDGTWDVGYFSDADIGGFQFNVDGASVNGASGGAAQDAGFMISASNTTVLGFFDSHLKFESNDWIEKIQKNKNIIIEKFNSNDE